MDYVYIMDSSKFKVIIEEQAKYKSFYNKGQTPPRGGICVVIKNNNIEKIITDGNVHGGRKRQNVQLIEDTIQMYCINDCNININLSDHPAKGYLNFCRVKGDKTCFLFPNHRFSKDDVVLDEKNDRFDNFDGQIEYIRQNYKPNKIPKVYTSCIPHMSKLDYFSYAANNTDICDGYCYTGSVHKKCHLNQNLYAILKNQNMAGEEICDWTKHLEYKYNLYNDGNTLSDRMRLLLCTDSIIIRSKSKYEEFYSYLLKDGENFIEYTNTSEIRDIVEKNEKDGIYDKIIENNKNFIDNCLNYNEVLKYTCLLINALNEE